MKNIGNLYRASYTLLGLLILVGTLSVMASPSRIAHGQTDENNVIFDGFPQWSPDGESIAFVSDRSGAQAIWIMNPDGTEVKNLTPDSSMIYTNPAWKPDGEQIAFVAREPGQKTSLWIMDSSGNNPLQIAPEDDLAVDQPSWSPDGRFIAYLAESQEPEGNDVWLADLEEESFLNLTAEIQGSFLFPTWSPDSHQLAFTQFGHELKFQTFVVSLEDKKPNSITGDWRALGAKWSTSNDVLYITVQHGTDLDIWSINSDGTNPVNLTLDSPAMMALNPLPSPDGKSIAFLYLDNVWLMDADGKNPINLTFELDGLSSAPAWSPDSRQIAFQFNADDPNTMYSADTDIWVINVDGSNPVNLTGRYRDE